MAPEADAGVLRARRLEIVDDQGRIRASIAADRDPYEGDVTVGLELLDEDGSARAWLVDVCGAAQLALALGGDQVAVLESIAHDDGTSTVALVLCDSSGRPVVRWAVQSDGTYSTSIDGEPTPGS
jgi:hypothetical protein